MSVRLSCPSCNSGFVLPAIPAGGRATCPRCGDVFPVRTAEEDRGQTTEDRRQPDAPFAQPKHQTPNTKHSSGRTTRIIVVLLLVGVAVGLVVYYTRVKPKTPEPSLVVTPTAPGQLIGVGYLPAECNVVFVVQPGPLVAYASHRKQEPRELLTQMGLPQQLFAVLDQAGLTLLDLDHIAGGLHIGDEGDELRVALVLVLKRPLADEDEVLQKLKARPVGKKPGRWGIELNRVPVSPVLAKASPTVWAMGLNERDFAAVERGGFGPGGVQFRGTELDALRGMIEKVPADAAVWAVAEDVSDWTQKPLVKLAAQSPEARKWVPAFKDGRGGLVAISLGEEPRLNLVVRTRELETSARIRTYFEARAAETPGASVGGMGALAQFEAPYDPATGWSTLQRFLEDARK
jgi:hypothetical protein